MRLALASTLILAACSPTTAPVEKSADKPSTTPVLASADVPSTSYIPTTLPVGVRVDVPSFLTRREGAQEDTTFSGEQVRMTLIASGSCGHTMKEICRPLAEAEKSFARSVTESSCLETGRAGDRIVWRRHRIADGVDYELALEYPAANKVLFDPIVEHISKSWTVPPRATDGYVCD